MMLDSVKAALLLFVAVLIQDSLISAYAPLGGSADLVLVVLLSIALFRGSIFGAAAGFRHRAAARHREPRHCLASPRCC
jgi:thiamine transporter ThiT